MTTHRSTVHFACLALVAALTMISPSVASGQPSTTPWGDPNLQGIWTNFDLGEGFSLEAPPPPGTRATRQLIGTGTCVPSDEPQPESNPDAVIGGIPAHWFETATDVGKVRPSLISEPAHGRLPALTETGSKRIDNVCRKAFDSYVYLDPWVRCITRGVPASTFPLSTTTPIRSCRFRDTSSSGTR